MSEQTSDTSNGLSEGAEPSMEDILASIRKIIADDEDHGGVLDASSELDANALDAAIVSQPDNLPDDLSVDVEDVAVLNNDIVDNVGETLDLDIIADVEPSESEIDALIADMDMIDTADETFAVADETLELEAGANVELEIPAIAETSEADAADDDLSSLEDLVLTEIEPETETVEAVDEISAGEASDDELSSLLDDMTSDDNDADDALAVIEDEVENSEAENLELVVDPAADLLDNDVDVEDELMDETASSDSDMALVKSLLADLTGEPLHEDANLDADTDMEATADIEEDIAPDVQDLEEDILEDNIVETEAVDIDDVEAETDDVMDEILSLTLDDEVELQAEVVAASGVEAPLSLKDIAAQAEADADALSGGKAIAGVAALGAAAKLMQTEETSEDLDDLELLLELEQDVESADEPEADFDDILSKIDETAETDTEIETELETLTDLTPDEETTPMPRAAKKDAIIDEVTESATADVFSSLNKVVEEKATVAERGDRIGDLVQEALRPMLKEWLDANLKGIVERAVTKEVKRISSGK